MDAHNSTRLHVIHRTDLQHHELLVYACVHPKTSSTPNVTTSRRIDSKALSRLIDNVLQAVEQLHRLARNGQPRGPFGLENVAAELTNFIMPPGGFSVLVPPGNDVLLETAPDLASRIPWEIVRERAFMCPNPEHARATFEHTPNSGLPPLCPHDHQPMKLVHDWMALRRNVSHFVRETSDRYRTSRTFLLVYPVLDTPPQSPSFGNAELQLSPDRLAGMVSSAGYHPHIVIGKEATCDAVRKALTDDRPAGLYFFGHGGFSVSTNGGYVRLADGTLTATDIESAHPTIGFAFLNFIEPDHPEAAPQLDEKYLSVACVLAQCSLRTVVISPKWPLRPEQADRTAMCFFRNLLEQNWTVADALSIARRESYEQYVAGEPNTAWAALRCYGDQYRRLMRDKPLELLAQTSEGVRANIDCDVLLDEFCYRFHRVIEQANFRRNRRNREAISLGDVFYGLLTKGELTRFVLAQNGVEELNRVAAHVEATDYESENRHKADLAACRASTFNTNLPPLESSVLELLSRAEEVRQLRHGSANIGPITEHDLLTALVQSGAWPMGVTDGLPSATSIGKHLASDEPWSQVDDDGGIRLDDLHEESRKILRQAYVFAVQRGICPIPNRLVCAAFLCDPRGTVAQRCVEYGINAASLASVLLAISNTGDEFSFPLNAHACDRVIIPMLKAARELCSPPIDAWSMFQAFAHSSSSELQRLLVALPWPMRLDLSALTSKDHSSNAVLGYQEFLEKPAWRILLRAAKIAQLQGLTEIRTPHLFAALIGEGNGPVFDLLREKQLDPYQVLQKSLAVIPKEGASTNSINLANVRPGRNLKALLDRAQEIATRSSRILATDEDLLAAMLENPKNIIPQILTEIATRSIRQQPRSEAVRRETTTTQTEAIPMPDQRSKLAPDPDSNKPADALILETGPTESTISIAQDDLTAIGQVISPLAVPVPIVHRNDEINDVLRILVLPERPHALLVGAVGVGKSAIMHGIAQRIAQRQVPRRLQDIQIVELPSLRLLTLLCERQAGSIDLASIVRGIGENLVFVLENIEYLCDHSLGKSVLWKLMQTSIRVVGTTTPDVYRQLASKHPAFIDGFHVVPIAPLLPRETIELLQVHRPVLESHYGVKVPANTIEATVYATENMSTEKSLPGSAKELLEWACANVSITRFNQSTVTVYPEDIADEVARRYSQQSKTAGIDLR